MSETAFLEEVATHVLVPVTVAEKLRDLSKKTRVTQSEYLREAVQDLLQKYAAENQSEPGAPEDENQNE